MSKLNKVSCYASPEDIPFTKYVEDDELEQVIDETCKEVPLIAVFVNNKCVHQGMFTEVAYKKLELDLHYKIN